MLNELADLYQSLENANISLEEWHQKYTEIRPVEKTPCVRVILCDGKEDRIEKVDSKIGKQIRRYGSNQGSFPAMNLRPLYRVTEEADKKYIKEIMEGKGHIDVERMHGLCRDNNWRNSKFQSKYSVCMKVVPNEIRQVLTENRSWAEMELLLNEAERFQKPEDLHSLLKEGAFRLLEMNVETEFALKILFYIGKKGKAAEDDGGNLTVVLDQRDLITREIPVVGSRFTREFNRRLLESLQSKEYFEGDVVRDAFGCKYDLPMNKANPMPAAALSGGFKITLRTMYGQQYCQYRYNQADDGSYRISQDRRREFKKALEWVGKAENENITWARVGLDERLFAYPEKLSSTPPRTVRVFKRVSMESTFKAESKQFFKELYGRQTEGDDTHAENIHIFIIRKLDKARMKMVFTRVTSAVEIESRSLKWREGSENHPKLSIGEPKVLFPLESSDVLNLVLKQSGEVASDKFKSVPYFHGMELFFGARDQAGKDLSILIRNAEKIAPMLIRQLTSNENSTTDKGVDGQITDSKKKPRSNVAGVIFRAQRIASLMGFLMLECGRRKEIFMQSYAYLYGRLLRVSDELHRQYCLAERKGIIPPQLVGGGMYMSAVDAPVRTLGLLGQRMLPYIMWAKTYSASDDQAQAVGLVKWLLSEYGKIAVELKTELDLHTVDRFSDLDRAEFFLGYIAAFSKNEKNGGVEDE